MESFKLYDKKGGFQMFDIQVKLETGNSGWLENFVRPSAKDETLRYLKFLASLLAPWHHSRIWIMEDPSEILVLALRGLEWVYFCTHTFDVAVASGNVFDHLRSAAKHMAPSTVMESLRVLQENQKRRVTDEVTKTAADTVINALREESEGLQKRTESQGARLTALTERKQKALEKVLLLKEC